MYGANAPEMASLPTQDPLYKHVEKRNEEQRTGYKPTPEEQGRRAGLEAANKSLGETFTSPQTYKDWAHDVGAWGARTALRAPSALFHIPGGLITLAGTGYDLARNGISGWYNAIKGTPQNYKASWSGTEAMTKNPFTRFGNFIDRHLVHRFGPQYSQRLQESGGVPFMEALSEAEASVGVSAAAAAGAKALMGKVRPRPTFKAGLKLSPELENERRIRHIIATRDKVRADDPTQFTKPYLTAVRGLKHRGVNHTGSWLDTAQHLPESPESWALSSMARNGDVVALGKKLSPMRYHKGFRYREMSLREALERFLPRTTDEVLFRGEPYLVPLKEGGLGLNLSGPSRYFTRDPGFALGSYGRLSDSPHGYFIAQGVPKALQPIDGAATGSYQHVLDSNVIAKLPGHLRTTFVYPPDGPGFNIHFDDVTRTKLPSGELGIPRTKLDNARVLPLRPVRSTQYK